MLEKCIVTYAAGAHEELLEVSIPTYRAFAERHGYDMLTTRGTVSKWRRWVRGDYTPPAWCKVPLLLDALERYEEAVWFDCDLVVVDASEDFSPIQSDHDKTHALVRHFERDSEVPNSGVWRLTQAAVPLLEKMLELPVFCNHGWWEQAALMTLMGYTVPPQGSDFRETKCRCVQQTEWYTGCQFMRLCWNSHPNYRAEHPRIVHCSYTDMQERIEVMRALVKDPTFNYPRYNAREEEDECAE